MTGGRHYFVLLLCWRFAQLVLALSTPVAEWEALRDLYVATSGDNWSTPPDSDSAGPIWNFTLSSAGVPLHDPCSDGDEAWRGLQCNHSATDCSQSSVSCSVVKVVLSGVGLYGTLPISLSNLSFLETMDIYDNSLHGNIPSSLGLLSNLMEIDLGENSMTGIIPHELGVLTRLSTLGVEWNNLVGPLPDTLGNLTNLQLLFVSNNSLSGTIPDYLVQLVSLKVLVMQDNYFSGIIPSDIGNLTNLEVLNLAVNWLTGTIPESIYHLKAMVHYWLFENILSGPVMLSGFSQLTALQDISLFYNYLTGSIGDLSHSLDLVYLYLENNLLTGTLPSSLGHLQALEHIYISTNAFTGNIPPLAGLTSLQYLYLNSNQLTGSLPTSIGALPSLLELQLQLNHLAGSLPVEVGQLQKLIFLSLHGNSFTNSLEGIFHSDLNLFSVDLGANSFSSSIPPALFDMTTLSVVVLSSNCFTGQLPATMCRPGAATVFSMDGLGAAKHCKRRKEMILSGVAMFNTLTGSIPSCVWAMSNLTVLHLSGNGLSGQIADSGLFHLPVIANFSLAHNQLSGTVPNALLAHSFKLCDMSYNRLTGVLNDESLDDDDVHDDDDADDSLATLLPYSESSFILQVNRLSGHFPSFSQKTQGSKNVRGAGVYTSLQLLRGNIFGCISGDFPPEEEDKDDYVCGSEDLDDAQLLLAVVLGLLLAGMVFLAVVVPRWTKVQTSFCRRLHLLVTHHLFYIRYMLCPVQSTDQESESNASMLCYIRVFCDELHNVAKVIVVASLSSIVLSIPLYALKIKDSTMEVPSYSTHYVQYSWLYTAALLTGDLPALLLIIIWTFLIVFLFCAFPYFLGKQSSESTAATTTTAAAVSYTQKKEDEGEGEATEDKKVPPSRKAPSSRLRVKMSCLFLINSVIVSIVNSLFIFSTYQSLSSVAHNSAQISLAIFKTFYNSRVVPSIASPIRDKKSNIFFRLCLSLFNQLLIPCIIGALTSPSCFKGLLVEAEEFSSFYTYSECYMFVTRLDGSMECSFYGDTTSEVEPIVPPFVYRYDCGSALMQAYIPVFVYVYIYQCLRSCCFVLVGSSFDYEVLPTWLQKRVCGLIWPDIWYGSARQDQPSSSENDDDDDGNCNCNCDKFRIPTTKKLSKFKNIASSDIFRHVVVLVTFGVCSPLLAVLIALTVLIKLHMWIALMGRFVHYRLVTMSRDHSEEAEADTDTCDREANESKSKSKSELPTLSDLLYLHPPALPHELSAQEQSRLLSQPADVTLVCIVGGLVEGGVLGLFDRCFQPILWSSALFLAGITWDLSSSSGGSGGGGWREGLWAPVSCAVVASLVWIYARAALHVTGGSRRLTRSPPLPLATTGNSTGTGTGTTHGAGEEGTEEQKSGSDTRRSTMDARRSFGLSMASSSSSSRDTNISLCRRSGGGDGGGGVEGVEGAEVELSESITVNPLLLPDHSP